MKSVYLVAKYIIQQNPWYLWGYIFFRSLYYLIFQKFTHRTIILPLFNRQQIFLFPNCPVSHKFFYTLVPEKKEITLLRQFATRDTIFLDIGAHIGSYSLLLADKVKTLYAFEPFPLNISRCRQNFALNEISQDQVIPIALSSRTKTVYFSNNDQALTENKVITYSPNSLRVKAMSLSHWASINHLSKKDSYLLKIDVEGHEDQVILGARSFLTKYPISGIIFESFTSTGKIFNHLHQLGFKTTYLGNNNYWSTVL